MLKKVFAASWVAALAVVFAPAAARADKVITAEVVWRYDNSDYTIDQGEKLSFKNTDSVSPGPHDVTADAPGPDGQKPLFKSETIKGDGTEVPVVGAQQLKTGTYTFHCSIHFFMTGTLHVTDKGAPLPPPGSGGGGQQPAPQQQQQQSQPAPDTTAPKVHAKLRPTTLRKALRARKLLVSVTSNELATLKLSAVARVRGRTVTLATATVTDGAPRRATDFETKLTAAGRRALRAARRLAVTVVVQATDQAGNKTTTRARRTLRR